MQREDSLGQEIEGCEETIDSDEDLSLSKEQPSQWDKKFNHCSDEKRIILLIDIDCYEYQVWMKRKRPDLRGKDVPGVAINLDKIIVAVNYSARKFGIKRGKGRRALDEALKLCPTLEIITVDTKQGLVDADYPLSESDKIVNVLRDYKDTVGPGQDVVIERSSRDEFYVDVTKLVKNRMMQEFFNAEAESFSIRSYATPPRKEVNQLTEFKKQFPHDLYAGLLVAKMESRKQVVSGKTLNYIIREIYNRDLEDYHLDETKLVFGAIIAQALIALIEQKTGYYASVGVGHSKLSAKLACDRNKPQGITIILDAAIPRLSREIEFQELPGFKGAVGKKLREEYKLDTGKELTTLQDVQRIGLNRTIKLFKKIKVPNPEILTIDLINKSYLRDEEPVHTRYYSDTVGLSMPFKGRHAVRSRADFMERIVSLSKLFIGRLKYRFDTHRILAAQCSVKAELKQNVSKTCGENNSMELRQLPNKEEMYTFVMNYIESNEYDVFAIVCISLKASKF